MTRKKKRLVLGIKILIPLLCFVIIPCLLYLIGRQVSSIKLKELNQAYWGITLPQKMKNISYKRTGFTDLTDHAIYQLAEGEMLSMNLNNQKSKEIESVSNSITDELQEEKIEFRNPYRWKEIKKIDMMPNDRDYYKHDDILMIIFFPESRQLHLLQIRR